MVGPKILGHATDLIFAGVIGRQLPPGITQDQAEAAARARGDDGLADLLSGMTVVPGQGIDFDALARMLMLVVVLYVVASLLMLVQGCMLDGVVQRTDATSCARDVEDKLHRLPLRYFDTQPRGELLSRVTNDIDNIAADDAADDQPDAQLAAHAARRPDDDGRSSRRCWRSSRWSRCRCRSS